MKTFKLTIWIFLAVMAGNISMAKASLDNNIPGNGFCSDVCSFLIFSTDFLHSSFSEFYLETEISGNTSQECSHEACAIHNDQSSDSCIQNIIDSDITSSTGFQTEEISPIVLSNPVQAISIREIEESSSSAYLSMVSVIAFMILVNPKKAYANSISYAKKLAYNFTTMTLKAARVGYTGNNTADDSYSGLRAASYDIATGRDSVSIGYVGLLRKVAYSDSAATGNFDNNNDNIDKTCVLARWLEAGCVILFAHIFNDKNSIVVRQLFWESVSEGFRQRLFWYSVCQQGRCRLAAAYSGFNVEKIWSMPDFNKSFAMSLPALSANSSLRAYSLKRTGEFIPFGISKSATSIQPLRQLFCQKD